MIKKFDNLAAGIIVGIIVPALFYYFFVYPTIKHYSFLGSLYVDLIVKMLPMFLSRCVFPNALLFFILLWTDMAKTAKGVLIVTGIITAVLLFINFVL
jgi:hypothetical protein